MHLNISQCVYYISSVWLCILSLFLLLQFAFIIILSDSDNTASGGRKERPTKQKAIDRKIRRGRVREAQREMEKDRERERDIRWMTK